MSENQELALRIKGVTKSYRLGQIGSGTLYHDLQSWFARVRGKEDPNQKIDQTLRLEGSSFMALNGVDLEVRKGEALGIIGANGAGKSTLLKLLSQVTGPTSGTIELFGRVSSMLEVGTGFHGEMTGRENVYLNGAILGMTRAEIDAKLDDIIAFSEVSDFIDTPVKRYSSGMYVKLAFSVAAHLDSEIMIMDEVLAVGDMAFQSKCLKKMKQAAEQEGKTVLYVSHNMNTIRQLCSRCIVLDAGKVVFDGDVEEAITTYMKSGKDSDLPVFYDLSQNQRHHQFGKQILIKSIRLLNKEQAIFETGEVMNYEVVFDSQVHVEECSIVMRIRDQFYGEKYGASISEKFTVQPGKNQTVRIGMRLEGLMEARYCFNFEIITQGETGSYYSYDNPQARIAIQVMNRKENEIAWAAQWWGNIRLPDSKVMTV